MEEAEEVEVEEDEDDDERANREPVGMYHYHHFAWRVEAGVGGYFLGLLLRYPRAFYRIQLAKYHRWLTT